MQLDQAVKRLQQQTADLEQQQTKLSQQLQEETSRQPDAVRCQARAAEFQ
jgi:prefoldin subunit 5